MDYRKDLLNIDKEMSPNEVVLAESINVLYERLVDTNDLLKVYGKHIGGCLAATRNIGCSCGLSVSIANNTNFIESAYIVSEKEKNGEHENENENENDKNSD